VVKTPETMAIDVIRLLILASQREDIDRATITVADDVAEYLNNKKRRDLLELEEEGRMTVQVHGAEGVPPEHLVVDCRDAEDREVKFNVL
jgi:ribonuclease E